MDRLSPLTFTDSEDIPLSLLQARDRMKGERSDTWFDGRSLISPLQDASWSLGVGHGHLTPSVTELQLNSPGGGVSPVSQRREGVEASSHGARVSGPASVVARRTSEAQGVREQTSSGGEPVGVAAGHAAPSSPPGLASYAYAPYGVHAPLMTVTCAACSAKLQPVWTRDVPTTATGTVMSAVPWQTRVLPAVGVPGGVPAGVHQGGVGYIPPNTAPLHHAPGPASGQQSGHHQTLEQVSEFKPGFRSYVPPQQSGNRRQPFRSTEGIHVNEGPSMLHSARRDDRVGHKTQKVPEYSGEEDWEDYDLQFSVISIMNLWDEREKGLHLVAALRGRAREVLRDLTGADVTNFEALRTALRKRFGAEREEAVSQAELTFLRRKPKETLRELWQRTKTVARRAYRNHHPETERLMACNGFINALDDRLKEYVMEKRPLSTDEALAHATLKEEIATAVSRSSLRPVRLVKKVSSNHLFKRRRWRSPG